MSCRISAGLTEIQDSGAVLLRPAVGQSASGRYSSPATIAPHCAQRADTRPRRRPGNRASQPQCAHLGYGSGSLRHTVSSAATFHVMRFP
ncbi:MAG: hypothetical protein K6U75_02990 [Firmicutes bacterium]|nr:hypothetical protein [Bacillota bacterium]